MHIAFVASEGVPFSKDRRIGRRGRRRCRARWRRWGIKSAFTCLVTSRPSSPKRGDRRAQHHHPFSMTSTALPRWVTGGSQSGVRFYFVDYPEYFDRDALYGTPAGDYPDNAERFALFSRRAGSDKDSGRAQRVSLSRLAVGPGSGAAAHRVCGRPSVPLYGGCRKFPELEAKG